MTKLSLSTAQKLAQATLDQGRSASAAPLAVAILDTGGHTQVLLREDGAGYLRADIAVAKAWGALGMTQSSAKLAERAALQPTFFSSLVEISHGRLGLSAGGVLIGDDKGEIIGAIGVSGDTAQLDEKCALAAIKSIGLSEI